MHSGNILLYIYVDFVWVMVKFAGLIDLALRMVVFGSGIPEGVPQPHSQDPQYQVRRVHIRTEPALIFWGA